VLIDNVDATEILGIHGLFYDIWMHWAFLVCPFICVRVSELHVFLMSLKFLSYAIGLITTLSYSKLHFAEFFIEVKMRSSIVFI
jgi:hypothetical protein